MKIINNKEEFNEAIKEKILVDFYADWCGPCKMLATQIEKVEDIIPVAKLNVDALPEIAKEYGVMSIPCIIIFEESKEIKRHIGFIPEEEIRNFIISD